MRTGTHELTNNTWDNIDWNANAGDTNDENLKWVIIYIHMLSHHACF